MSDTVISVENLGKKYFLSHQRQEPYLALRDVMTEGVKNAARKIAAAFSPLRSGDGAPSREEFWALKDVSFEINQGDRIGIIGRNGAGKSTLLKILSRITEPTEGRVRIKGRVASLLEVGTGFHPELTGRENIFLNGAVLGMTRIEIKKKFDEIVAFAEVERFLDTPVKHYSSGMYVRLAFAVAAHLEPEVLVVDEVLAVGDAQFQKKCLGKMEEVGKEGRTVLFVSHNMGAINTLTRKCLLLEKGEISYFGDTYLAVDKYFKMSLNIKTISGKHLDYYRPDYIINRIRNDKAVCFKSIWIEHNHTKTSILDMGDRLKIFVELESFIEVSGANLSLSLLNSEGQFVTVMFSLDNDYYINLKKGKHVITVEFDDIMLCPGKYYLNLGINQSTDTNAWDGIMNYPLVEILNSGTVIHWLNRPWGLIHCKKVKWNQIQ